MPAEKQLLRGGIKSQTDKDSVMWFWGRGHYSSIQEKYQLIKEGIRWKSSLVNQLGLHIRAWVTQYHQEVPWAPWGQPHYCRVSPQTRVQSQEEVPPKDLRKVTGLLSCPISSRRKCRLAHLDFNLDLVRVSWVVTVALNQDDHGHGQHGGKSSTVGSFLLRQTFPCGVVYWEGHHLGPICHTSGMATK